MTAKNYLSIKALAKPRLVVMVVLFFALHLGGAVVTAQTAVYSEIWGDDSNPNSFVIRARGITEESYNSYSHEYVVNSTITSANGRTAFDSVSNGSSGQMYAIANTSLAWDENDLGNYFISSEHVTYCPYYNMEANPTVTVQSIDWGVSKSLYREFFDTPTNCEYRLVDPCNVACKGNTSIMRSCETEYIVRIQPWGYVNIPGGQFRVCYLAGIREVRSVVAQSCQDISG